MDNTKEMLELCSADFMSNKYYNHSLIEHFV